jgi:hypothetical protein
MARVVKGSVRFGSILASTAMLSCAQELPSDRAEGPTSSGDTFVATLLHGESTSFGFAESATDGNTTPTNLAEPSSEPVPIVEGFALEVSKTVGGDLKIEWADQEVDEYEVWTAADPYFAPDGPGAVMVTTTEDLYFETPLGGEAYYRIRAVGAEQEDSTTVGQVEHDLIAGYNKFGIEKSTRASIERFAALFVRGSSSSRPRGSGFLTTPTLKGNQGRVIYATHGQWIRLKISRGIATLMGERARTTMMNTTPRATGTSAGVSAARAGCLRRAENA